MLTVDKSSPNALLTWTDSAGQPLSSYDVYRGTSPRVMSQVGTGSWTYTDDNALTNNVLYFYSVDPP